MVVPEGVALGGAKVVAVSTGDLVPDPGLRLSDADREQAVARLNEAVGEGRLTLSEFEDRVGKVLAARTAGELVPHLADLPGVPNLVAPEVSELRSRASSLRRRGRWVVPRRLVVETRSSSVRLDFTSAVIASPVVEVAVNLRSSSLRLVLPPGASADADSLEMRSSSVKVKVPDQGGVRFLIVGAVQSSSIQVRYQRRFLRWRW